MHTTYLLTVSQHALCRGVYPSLQSAGEGVCISAMHWAGEVSAGGGMSAQGGVCWGGCLPRGNVCPGGMFAKDGGLAARGCVADTPPPREQNDRQVYKTLPCHNFIAGGNYDGCRYFFLLPQGVIMTSVGI